MRVWCVVGALREFIVLIAAGDGDGVQGAVYFLCTLCVSLIVIPPYKRFSGIYIFRSKSDYLIFQYFVKVLFFEVLSWCEQVTGESWAVDGALHPSKDCTHWIDDPLSTNFNPYSVIYEQQLKNRRLSLPPRHTLLQLHTKHTLTHVLCCKSTTEDIPGLLAYTEIKKYELEYSVFKRRLTDLFFAVMVTLYRMVVFSRAWRALLRRGILTNTLVPR